MAVFIFLIAIIIAPFALSQDLDYRLNGNILPSSYDITIKPYLLASDGDKRFTFDGKVNIVISTQMVNMRSITLHKDYIDIKSASITSADGALVKNWTPEQMQYESATDKLTLNLDSALTRNRNYTLNFVYTGQIRNGTSGFFRVNYMDAMGEEKWIALTQLQRIDARTLFPCFDEPNFKATFLMHINRPNGYKSHFNTRLLSTTNDGSDRQIDNFAQTPEMSTYLVALIVSEYVEQEDGDNYTMIVRPEYLNKTQLSFDVGRKALKAYGDYTQLPYASLGNTKFQQTSSPKFPHNGMENWGLIMYRDSVLVEEPGYTDGWSNKEYTITIIVHETAHMWFGNSVTFVWWSYFWLNEAFARYYQYFMAHQLYPEYQLDQQFVVNQVHLIFGIDAVNSTQPMTTPYSEVNTPAQIASKFSSIAYAKGASIVRMFCNLMSQENFDTAIRGYLKENQGSNTDPDQLFDHLKRNWPQPSKVNLDEFFKSWTEQVGFPMLNVTLSDDAKSVTIQQSRFLLAPQDGSNASLLYIIPITYATNTNVNFSDLTPIFYLNATNETYTWQLPNAVDWIIFNLQQSNYYRVFYDFGILRNIQAALQRSQHSNIHVINRAQLLDDVLNYGRVGLLDYDQVFEFLEYLKTETDYLPWYAAFNGLQRIAQRITVQQQTSFVNFIFDVTSQVYNKLGFQNEADTVLDVYNRNKVISWLCKYRHADCNTKARNAFDDAVKSNVKPSPDFRETLYCSAVRFGVVSYYNTVFDWFNETNLESEKQLLASALGCTVHFADTHFLTVIATNKIPVEYKQISLSSLYAQNPENVDLVFNNTLARIDQVAEALGSWSAAADLVSDIANYLTTRAQETQLNEFIEQNSAKFGSSVTKLNNAAKTVKNNLQWAETRLIKMFSYLSQRNAAEGKTLALSLLIAMTFLICFSRKILF